MIEWFDTPLRAASLGVLIVLAVVLLRGVLLGRPYRIASIVLSTLALGMVAASEGIQ